MRARRTKAARKTLIQVTAAVTRLEKKYGDTARLLKSLDQYFMRENTEDDATEFLIIRLDRIERIVRA